LPVATIQYTGGPFCTAGIISPTVTGTSGGLFSSAAGLTINAATGVIDLNTSLSGSYTVFYVYSNGLCSNMTSATVLIQQPLLTITNPTAACAPGTVDLTDPAVTAGSAAGLTYSYYTDALGTLPLANPNAVGAGTYYIKGVTALGCPTLVEPVTATVNARPSITVTPANTMICKGSSTTLTANSPGNTIQWINLGAGATVIVSPLQNTTYQAVATNPAGCSDTANALVQINPFAVSLTANPDPVIAGTNLQLTSSANAGYTVMAWLPASLFPNQSSTTQSFNVPDTSKGFSVIAQDINGCLDTATIAITVNANLKDFFIPNSFTPNNDGKNDVFKVYGSSIREMHMSIFNQWGQQIFETRNAQSGWDGNYNGHPQQTGVYVYLIQVVFSDNSSITRKGTVNLIR
jgi:gliding motility-associated-like protein